MVRRQPPANSRKTTPRKTPQAPVVDRELLPEDAGSVEATDLEKDAWAETVTVEVVAEPKPDVAPKEDPAIPALETSVTALKESLDQSNQKEQHLQKSVEDLRSQLDEQTSIVQKLQVSLEKATKIQSELDKTQKEALKLAESNQALIDENKALKQAQQTLKAELETKAKSAQLTVQPAPAKPAAESRDDSFRRQQAATLAHPVFPNGPMSNGFSDQDIGWFD
jgi:predicted RNase H-like nuclease (RuvC/YqgF family)